MAMPTNALRGPAGEPIAFAGGPIFVPLGLLASAENESVFAFQLAHAMAHVALRHPTRLATRLENMRNRGRLRMPGGADFNAKFVQQCELQADSVAAGMVVKAGYDAEAVVRYLERLPVVGFGFGRIAGSQRAEVVRVEMKKVTAQVRGGQTGEFEESKALATRIR
jgi:predicted Zn-dependent protease